MISAETLAELEKRELFYILGVHERSDRVVCELVLNDPGPFVPLTITKRRKESDYGAKAVMLGPAQCFCGLLRAGPLSSTGASFGPLL